MSEVILLDGGLDTSSSPLAAKRGGLRACQNYEVGVERGYRRIDGIEIYDGSINPDITHFLRITVSATFASASINSSVIGQPIVFPDQYTHPENSVVTAFSYAGGVYTFDVALSKASRSNLIPKTFNVLGVSVQPSNAPLIPYDAVFSLGAARLQSDVNTDYQQPPRHPGLSINQKIGGLFWRNDKLYAITDCIKINVKKVRETGNVGSRHIPGNGAYLYLQSETVPFGEVLFKEGETFTYVQIGTSFPQLNDVIKIGDGVAQYTFDSLGETKAAVLWVANHGGVDGWTRVETNRVASYAQNASCDPALFFDSYNRFAFQNTTAQDVVTSPEIISNTAIAEALYWKNPTNVNDNDADFTEYAADLTDHGFPEYYYAFTALRTTSQQLKCGFDFSGIPRTARLLGIKLKIRKRMGANAWYQVFPYTAPSSPGDLNLIYDDVINLTWPKGTSENKAKAELWPASATDFYYGGVDDLWGSNASLTDLLDESFFATITVRNGNTFPVFKACEISSVSMEVSYITQSNDVYIYRAGPNGINRKVIIPHRTIQSGSPALKTAKGQIIIEIPNKDPLVGLSKDVIEGGVYLDSTSRGYVTAPGDELRTGPGPTGGSLIAVLTTADGPQYLPSNQLLKAESKRWYSIQASPYAQDNSDISILCNGIGQAYVWDDRNLLPVSTGLDAKYEKPSFSAYWGNALVLGYDTGTIIFSDVGNPLSFTGGAAGAAEIDVSDKITGILALKGEALGVFTERTIQALYGDDITNLARKIISPNSGAIPYTVCDMGVPVFTDFRGTGTVDAVLEYGDFQRGRWSYAIQNYITPLIQNESQFLGVPTKVLCAYPVRNKNQYRLCFSDASTITMTLVGSGLEQQFTTQSVYGKTMIGEKVFMPYLAVEHGVTSSGRDVVFCSLDSTIHNGYVFRVDQGNSFPSVINPNFVGDPIEAHIDLNFNHSLDRPSSTSRIDRLALYGVCKGYATLGLNQSLFYGNLGEYTAEFIAGNVLATAEKPAKYFMSIIDSGCEARDISFRISCNNLEASHTLQAIEVFQTIDGQRKDDKR